MENNLDAMSATETDQATSAETESEKGLTEKFEKFKDQVNEFIEEQLKGNEKRSPEARKLKSEYVAESLGVVKDMAEIPVLKGMRLALFPFIFIALQIIWETNTDPLLDTHTGLYYLTELVYILAGGAGALVGNDYLTKKITELESYRDGCGDECRCCLPEESMKWDDNE